MWVKYLGSTPAKTTKGYPIKGCTWYVFELESEFNAKYCEASFLMFVRSYGANALFHRENRLVMETSEGILDGNRAEHLKEALLRMIEDKETGI